MNKQELINRMIESVKNSKRFEAMTNAELADLLMSSVWAGMDMFTPNSDLISAVIDRLREDREKVS